MMAAKKSAAAVADAISRLAGSGPGFEPLAPAAAKGAKPGKISSGRPAETATATASGGSEELDYAQREYYAARPLATTDGVFVFMREPIKSVLMVGNYRDRYKEPTE